MTNTNRLYLTVSGVCFGRAWMQIAVIRDEQVTWIEFEKALLGWNYSSHMVQGGEDWEGRKAEQIKSWKLQNHAGISECSAEQIAQLPELAARYGIPL